MKRLIFLLIGFILVMLTQSAQSQLKIKEGDELFVKEASEKLRLSPSGSVICQLPQGTKVYAIGEEGNWVAVQLVGYIWKKSLTDSRFNIPGFTVRALHIMVQTEAEANEIKQLLAQGADFKQLAKERSKAPTADKGGDLGIITKGDLLPELDKAISALNVGGISEVIKTDAGFHIFKRIE
ncbi:MAG: peptidylprolyl isomerase [candidate division KSB1 bacterium]|nr:peptidylprolyl isomerase [candidate division KSB1 bacterium]